MKKLLPIIIALLISNAYSESYVRVVKYSVINEYPNGLPPLVSYAPDRPYYNATFRHAQDGIMPATFATTPDGMVKISSTWTNVDGTMVETGTYETVAENEARLYAEKVATITPELWATASVFNQIMTIHFGAGAVTNEGITESTVSAYFINRRLTLPASERADDAGDAMLLTQGFEAIKQWTGTDNIWSFPWEMVP